MKKREREREKREKFRKVINELLNRPNEEIRNPKSTSHK